MTHTVQAYMESAAGTAAAAMRRVKNASDRWMETNPRWQEARTWVRDGVDGVAGKFGYHRDPDQTEPESRDDLDDQVRQTQAQTNRMDAKLKRAQDDIASLRRRVLQLEAKAALAKDDDEKDRR
ncbi:hypothetical protein [Haloglycomyces albus]|uniref:hypothetical protein n=1 Tax=Haloglycomyces albus TaxID=526067 RepID=UPI0012EB1925|nr:hypothetical protein [Haloglycomyces albus]